MPPLKRTQHDNSRAPSLHGRYSASSLLWTPPTPDKPAHRVMDSPATSGLRTPACRASQVPRPFLRCALSAITPMGRPAASADCFTERAGFIHSERLATHNLCLEAVSGSTLWLTAHSFAVRRSPAFAGLPALTGLAPRALLPPHDRPQLHVLSATYMATSFQIAGKVRLDLTHRKTRKNKCLLNMDFVCFRGILILDLV